MFYYVSSDGKQAVRSAVAKQIIDHIEKQGVNDQDLLSLTIVGHSAGSVVGFDFLFYLFSNKKCAKEFCSHDQEISEAMKSLESRIKNGALRVRRFITFGSPIALVACRSDAVVQILSDGQRLDAMDYGLKNHIEDGVSELDGPRWLNFWDKDDPISWPVEPLMNVGSLAATLDLYIDVSDSVKKAHSAYWASKYVYRENRQTMVILLVHSGCLVPRPVRMSGSIQIANGNRSRRCDPSTG